MQAVRRKGTAPELAVRSFLHRMGFRFRLHKTDLPGTPDIVLPSLKTVIFVDGCFWHQHSCAKGRTMPKSNEEFWELKFQTNIKRDRRNHKELRGLGWRVIRVWECETKSNSKLSRALNKLTAN
jgi:DNA mismatch endonuclease (patch repair protein)